MWWHAPANGSRASCPVRRLCLASSRLMADPVASEVDSSPDNDISGWPLDSTQVHICARAPVHTHVAIWTKLCTHMQPYAHNYAHTCSYTHTIMHTHVAICTRLYTHKRQSHLLQSFNVLLLDSPLPLPSVHTTSLLPPCWNKLWQDIPITSRNGGKFGDV